MSVELSQVILRSVLTASLHPYICPWLILSDSLLVVFSFCFKGYLHVYTLLYEGELLKKKKTAKGLGKSAEERARVGWIIT